MFYWLGRKGFSICVEDQTLGKVREFSTGGATYFIAQRSHLNDAPGFEAALRENFALVSEREDFLVFDISK
jgi:hypothetical protein